MSETPPHLFDTTARERAQSRAARLSSGPDFMTLEVSDRMRDRLTDINRTFDTPLDIGGKLGLAGAKTVADSDILELEPQSANLVTSVLALHAKNDPVGTLIQAARALKPDGFLLMSLFGGDTLHELRHAFLEAEAKVTGGARQRVFPFGDVRDLGGLIGRAGLALPVADVDRITVTYDHPLKLLADLRAMGEVNIMADRSRSGLRRDVLMTMCDVYLTRFAGNDGRIPATFDIIYLSGWAPHESQQKPAKRGSGTVSFAEALKGKPPKRPV